MNGILKPLNETMGKLFESGYMLCHLMERMHDLRDNYPEVFEKYRYKLLTEKGGEYFLKHLPCSQIKNDVPMKLFSDKIVSKTGFMIDARDVDFIYTAPNIIYNNYDLNMELRLNKQSVFPETDAIQGVRSFNNPTGLLYRYISTDISEQRNKLALMAIDRSWELIGADHEHYYKKSRTSDKHNPMVTESLVNVQDVRNIKAVIYCSENANIEPCNSYKYNGLLQAVVLKGFLAAEFDHEVPLVFYQKNKAHDFSMPTIKEVELDKDIISDAIKKSNQRYHKTLLQYSEAALGCKLDRESISAWERPDTCMALIGFKKAVNEILKFFGVAGGK